MAICAICFEIGVAHSSGAPTHLELPKPQIPVAGTNLGVHVQPDQEGLVRNVLAELVEALQDFVDIFLGQPPK